MTAETVRFVWVLGSPFGDPLFHSRMCRSIPVCPGTIILSREYLRRATARYVPGTSSPMADRSMLSRGACKVPPGGQNELRPRDPQTPLQIVSYFEEYDL
jgi:hypothetical protein